MKTSSKFIAGAAIGLVLAGTVPTVNQAMTWRLSYETVLFNTVDGDLDFGQYAVDVADGGFYVRPNGQNYIGDDGSKQTLGVVPKDKGNFTVVPATFDVSKLTLVQVIGSTAYDEFIDSKGFVQRFQSSQQAYRSLSQSKGAPQPTKDELVAFLGAKKAHALAITASTTASTTGASSLSFSHTINSGETPVFCVAAQQNRIASVSYNSANATDVVHANDTGNNTGSSIFILPNSSTGSNTVTVTRTSGTSGIYANVQSWTGVDQATSTGNTAATSTTGTALALYTTTITQARDNSVIIDCGGMGGAPTTPYTVGANQITIANYATAAENLEFNSTYETDTRLGSSHTMSGTLTSARRGGLSVIELLQAASILPLDIF